QHALRGTTGAARPKAGRDFRLSMLPIRRQGDRHWFADRLFGLVAEEPFGALVKSRDNPVEVFAENRIIRVFDHSREGAVYVFEMSLPSIEFSKNSDLRAENVSVYRFPNIIHSALLLSLDNLLIVIVIGGQKDDRHVGGLLARFDHLGEFKSCDSRHADVENEESKFVGEQRKQRLFSGLSPNE